MGRALIRLVVAAAALVVALAILRPGPSGAAPPSAFWVIVNPNNPAVALDRKFLADAFLKKTTRWPGGEVVRPVDLRPDSPVRRRFSEDVLGRSIAAVKSYWQQLIFSGRAIPPPELDSDEEVLRYVGRHPGAVGYVSGTAELRGVKAVNVK
jgi:ABC-type phosphate transport system substrate-binding protein